MAEKLKKELRGIVDGYILERADNRITVSKLCLQEENKSLRDKLEMAYEFMKQFVSAGINLLEMFMDLIGKKVRDVGR